MLFMLLLLVLFMLLLLLLLCCCCTRHALVLPGIVCELPFAVVLQAELHHLVVRAGVVLYGS
jgi:hypothetical protein